MMLHPPVDFLKAAREAVVPDENPLETSSDPRPLPPLLPDQRDHSGEAKTRVADSYCQKMSSSALPDTDLPQRHVQHDATVSSFQDAASLQEEASVLAAGGQVADINSQLFFSRGQCRLLCVRY
mmetsp:Transcript_22247/g.56160  ORF Transcript_22247/g.56160 Transcript_22247/m.56160 type:complete len:124 (-) Transcript_22247:4416-4787(-)